MNELQPKLRLTICRTQLADSLSREETVRLLAVEMGRGDSSFAEAVAASALAREAEESTYVGRGLAVPHARLAGLAQPCVCLASGPGVDWSGGVATLVALLAVPEAQPEWHLHLLGALARYVSAHHGEVELADLAATLQTKTA